MTDEEKMFRLREDLNLSYEDIGRLLKTPASEVRKIVEAKQAAAREAIKQRPERNREMWRLRKEEDLTYTAIGEKFGISPGRVSQIVDNEQQRFMREEWAAKCRANAKEALSIYRDMLAAPLSRSSASARLFERLFPEEGLPITVVQEHEVLP